MSSKINQNISACLGCICEDTKILVVNSRPLSLGLCDQWGHGVICKHNISKNQGLIPMHVAYLIVCNMATLKNEIF